MKRNLGLYLAGKALLFIFSIWLLSLAVFYIARFAPGDPLLSYYGERVEKMSPEERLWAEKKLGLDAPVRVQYLRWLGNALQGDFGISYKYKRDVLEVIEGRIGNTLLLGGTGFLLVFVLSLPLGILCAMFEDKIIDRFICFVGTVVSCIPEFWLSLLFLLVFAIYLPVFPVSGAYDIGRANDLASRIRHLVLPVSVVAAGHLWYYAYMVRNKILEEACADYVLLAKAKGLGRQRVMVRHCLRNVLPSYFSIMAVAVPHMLGGTYIVEVVFSYPGIGTLSYESARYQDYNLLMVLCILSGTVVIVCNMAAQMINEHIDPRMKGEESADSKSG